MPLLNLGWHPSGKVVIKVAERQGRTTPSAIRPVQHREILKFVPMV